MEIIFNKKKLDFSELVEHMQHKGVQFEIASLETPEYILEHSNYYYKLSAYRSNFPKNPKGKYIHLDFQYLVDLASIDMQLRYIFLQMTLDIEHFLKTKILADITKSDEDGYGIVERFAQKIGKDPESFFDHIRYTNRHYNYDLYLKRKNDLSIWVLFEIMTFGEFVRFVEFYNEYEGQNDYVEIASIIRYVKNIRNICAHSSPILIKLNENTLTHNRQSKYIKFFVEKIKNISKHTRKKRLENQRIHDVTALLYCYSKYVVSHGVRKKRNIELQLVVQRMKKNINYYNRNQLIQSIFGYIDKLVDFVVG